MPLSCQALTNPPCDFWHGECTYFCTFFPVSTDPRMEITGEGAGPILVMGTTGDPATPLSSTESMAEALEDGRLVVVSSSGRSGTRVT